VPAALEFGVAGWVAGEDGLAQAAVPARIDLAGMGNPLRAKGALLTIDGSSL
jgi:hypothetical protein